jgi:hypothetical protein
MRTLQSCGDAASLASAIDRASKLLSDIFREERVSSFFMGVL